GAALLFSWDNKRYTSSSWWHPYGKHLPTTPNLLIKGAGFPYHPDTSKVLIEDCPWMKDRLVGRDVLYAPNVYRMMPAADQAQGWAKTAEQVKALMKNHKVAGEPLGIDWTGPAAVIAFQKAGLNVVDANPMMQESRMIKSDEEIELMRQAATCNENGYAQVARDARPGMRENEVQAIMAKGFYEAGAEYCEGWVVNSGPRTSPRSFNWADRTIRPGDFLTLEACHVTFCGYKVCYDRSFVVGAKPTELQKEIYNTSAEMHRHLQTKIFKVGMTTHELLKLRPTPTKPPTTVDEIKKYRASWANHFGGIGIGWDEAPYISADYPPVKFEKNMVFAYHCIFAVEGYQGVAVENTYRVTETGLENFCKWPWEELMVIGFPYQP
ncbi:MAG: M24 family metallopeptidase, partial [Candidatus Bathyarchaeota archaeon]